MSDNTSLDRLLPVKHLVQRHPNIGTEAAVRFQVFQAETNGLAEHGAVLRVGRKVLIDADRYLDWLTAHRVISARAP